MFVFWGLFKIPARTDGLNMELSAGQIEGEQVKRENAENMLAEDRDGTLHICTYR